MIVYFKLFVLEIIRIKVYCRKRCTELAPTSHVLVTAKCQQRNCESNFWEASTPACFYFVLGRIAQNGFLYFVLSIRVGEIY